MMHVFFIVRDWVKIAVGYARTGRNRAGRAAGSTGMRQPAVLAL